MSVGQFTPWNYYPLKDSSRRALDRSSRFDVYLQQVLITVFCLAVIAPAAMAKNLFEYSLQVGDDSGANFGSNILKVAAKEFGEDAFTQTSPTYSGTELVVGRLDLRGLEVLIGFEEDSADLVVTIPDLNLTYTFKTDKTLLIPLRRLIVQGLLHKWMDGDLKISPDKSDGGGGGSSESTSISPLLAALIEYSPVEPVAGNPSSLEAKMNNADFRIAMTSLFLSSSDADEWKGRWVRQFRTAASIDFYDGGPYKGQSYDIDLGIEFNTPSEKIGVVFDLPLGITNTQSANSLMGSLGAGVVIRATQKWNITPILRVGVAGSIDAGAGAMLFYGGLASAYRIHKWNTEFVIGNMFTAGTNFDGIRIGDITIDYDLDAYIFRNGFQAIRSIGIGFLGLQPTASIYFNATNYLGSERYLQNQFDVGLGLGLPIPRENKRDVSCQFNMGYVGGKNYDSLRLELMFTF
jgi:hypothetical protein